MDSKQLDRNLLLKVMLYVLFMMFVIVQPGFADDNDEQSKQEYSYSDKDGYSSSEKDEHKDDEKDEHKDDDKDEHKDDDKDDEPPPPGPPPGEASTENFIAIHDRNSNQYNDNCNSCHADIHTRQTLDPSIPDAHVAMLSATPGEGNDDNNKCTWCHRSVDLVQATGSPQQHVNNIRKTIDTRLCTVCHGPGGTAKQFYRVGVSALNLNNTELYGLVCSGCHGSLGASEVQGESTADIVDAINEDEGGMSPLQVLTPEQIQGISSVLN